MAGPTTFDGTNWSEFVRGRHPGGGDHFSRRGDGEAALVGFVDNDRLEDALRFCLGHCQLSDPATDGPTLYLQRTLPVRHPRWQNLVCDDAHAVPFSPPNRTGPVPANSSRVKRYVTSDAAKIGAYADYTLAELTLRFGPPEYEVLGLPDVGFYTQPADSFYQTGTYGFYQEWGRFTSIRVEPRMETLSVAGNQLVFAEGEGCPDPPYSNPKGSRFTDEQYLILVKSDVSVTTHQLPHDFLFPAGSYLPRTVMAALGTVNRYPLLGGSFPAGTLLYLGAKMQRRRWALQRPPESAWLWEVEHLFSFFDPDKGFTGSGLAQITTRRGHVNCPWRGTVTAGDRNGNRFFFATKTGDPNDPAFIENFDHHFLWLPCSSPVGTGAGFYPRSGRVNNV